MAVIPYLPEMVEYVKTLDVDKDLEILRTNGIELADRANFVFRIQHMVLKLGVLGGYVPKDIGDLLIRGLGTLYYNCMARYTDVTLILNSLEDSIKAALQFTREYVSYLLRKGKFILTIIYNFYWSDVVVLLFTAQGLKQKSGWLRESRCLAEKREKQRPNLEKADSVEHYASDRRLMGLRKWTRRRVQQEL